jgi:hypothetical protein
MNRALILTILLLACCPAAAAQGNGDGVRLGILAGGYWLTRGDAKATFGDVWPNLDLALYWPQRERTGGFTADLSFRWGKDDGEATLVPLTIGWWEDMDELLGEDQPKSWRSYAAARFGPYYGRIKGVPDDESTIGWNAHFLLGAIFGRRFIAELRYDWYSKIADTNFEGLTFQIGILLGG